MTQVVKYDVRRRNNVIEIGLDPMEIIAPKLDDTIIPFGRDTVKTDSGGECSMMKRNRVMVGLSTLLSLASLQAMAGSGAYDQAFLGLCVAMAG